MELLEVYTDDNETKIGVADRNVVHYYELWHREIACWIINDKNEVLLQRRSANKKQQPNMLAVTAGHIDLQESPIEATMREVTEEIGINDVEEKDFIYLGTFKANNKNNYHYKYVYLLRTNKKLENLKMQESEVSELLYVSLDKLKEMISSSNNELTFAKHYYTPIILNKIEELLNYEDHLTSKYIEKTMPDELIIKDNEDLKKKLSERIKKIESGKAKMLTIDEAFEKFDNLLWK